MDKTMTTTDQLSKAQQMQAYQAHREGRNADWIAAQFGVYPDDMRRFLSALDKRRMLAERQTAEQAMGAPAMLNAHLFAALDDLKAATDSGDPEAMELQIKRAYATERLAAAVIDNMGVMLKAVELQARVGQEASVPKSLLGA